MLTLKNKILIKYELHIFLVYLQYKFSNIYQINRFFYKNFIFYERKYSEKAQYSCQCSKI